MIYRELGESGIKISAITFGAWAIGGFMWGGSDEKQALGAIRRGYDLGVTAIDTAPIYGTGLSEELVGKAIKGNRENYQILTKFGMRWSRAGSQKEFSSDKGFEDIWNQVYLDGRKEGVMQEAEESLRRLDTDYIDYYQMHWPVENAPIEETMEALVRLKEQGKIRAAGVCNFSAAQLMEAEKTIRIEADQVAYNMVRRDIEKDVVPYLLKHNKGIIAYSPMQRGLLTGKFYPDTKLPEGDNRKYSRYFKPENIRRVNEFLSNIKPIAEAHEASLAQLALSWTIHQPGVITTLAGSRSPGQIEDNARAAEIELTPDELQSLNHHLNNLDLELDA
jgi:aryl-alcohol dehydrogenase-like predicted oxidoreductase